MKILEITKPNKPMLTEAKARIDHPEDIILDDNGVAGALRALDAIEHAAANHATTTTVKWDGSPAVLFGWLDSENFVVTDKAGIGAKKYDGRPTSAEALSAMIFNRKPDQPGRTEYAAKFAGVYDLLKAVTPKSTKGKIIQGDMLWMRTEELTIDDDSVGFKPNKIAYDIGLDTDLGKQIARSQAGVVIHSYYESTEEAGSADGESKPATPTDLGIKSKGKLVVVGPETSIPADKKIKAPMAEIESLRNLLRTPAAAKIDQMLDPFTVGSLKIANLTEIFKKFINSKAAAGQTLGSAKNLAKEFMTWAQSPASGLTANKLQNVMAHIKQFNPSFSVMWQIISGIADVEEMVKDQLDKSVDNGIKAANGHEGFVSSTPHGKIKFVNRASFMKKDQ
jgi:hypothetical protein